MLDYYCYISMIAVTIVFNAAADNYYVSMTGNDENTGTSKDAPWQHCPGMHGWSGSGIVKAGDTVFFNNADTWEVASGDVVLQVIGGVFYDGKAWGAGKKAHFKATGDLNRSVISFMHDHPSIPTVVRGFDADAGGHITTGIGINHPQMQNQLLGAMKRIEQCDVHDVASFAPSTYKYGIVISNWSGKYQVSNVEVFYCRVYNISRGGINLYPGNDSTTNWIKNILVRGNEVWNTGLDTSYGGSCMDVKNHVINSILEYNYVHDPARGIGIGVSTNPVQGFIGPENAVIRYNIVSGSKHAGIYVQDLGNKSVEIYGNIVMKSKYHGIILTQDLTDTLSIKIYNNTFFHNFENTQWSEEIRVLCKDAKIKTLEIKNNLIYAYPQVRCLLDDYGVITSHSNNLYYNPAGGNLVIANGTAYTAANISSWESTALTADPLFRDTATLPSGFTGTFGIDMRPFPEGLALTSTSPAKDKGADLGTDCSGSINSVKRPFDLGWDIGAYEYSTAMGINHSLQSKRGSGIQVKCMMNHIFITYHAPRPVDATVSLLTVSGKMIASVSKKSSTGLNVIEWKYSGKNGTSISKGCYVVYLKTAGAFFTKRIMLP